MVPLKTLAVPLCNLMRLSRHKRRTLRGGYVPLNVRICSSGQPLRFRPVTSIRLNTCPLFMPVQAVGSLAPGYELGMDEPLRRATLVTGDTGLRQRLIKVASAGRTPFPESAHVEDHIYAGFYSRTDHALIDEFHKSDWTRPFELVGSFADQRLRTLARRLVYCEAPGVLLAKERGSMLAPLLRASQARMPQ
ncbi:hypothetical protein [Mesorhizobium sp. IMUNJ 23232]|uniref:hypothetical protein n=1 Tax=Mesorhizobium sp. IMUNJ 23232 TaxID=3376064 RepID=UPI0037959713